VFVKNSHKRDPISSSFSGLNEILWLWLDFGIPFAINEHMESIDTQLATRIRQDILLGTYTEGERLSEAQLCDTHNVSRTPVRLALRLLEREGVIRRGDGRGYLVQSPTVDDILQAVEVRGHLESLAARLMAQNADRVRFLPEMNRAIDQIEIAIEHLVRLGELEDSVTRRAQAANKEFHSAILAACGNDYVGYTCKQISHLPMLAVGSMVFDRTVGDTPDHFERGMFRLRLGNAQHRVIYEAIETGDPVRAEGMMREHSHTMVEYIQTFEKRDESLSVADLVAYFGEQPAGPSV
jgi:GntR family transcriptional regulator, vanillate catabolism transcriptional regulator